MADPASPEALRQLATEALTWTAAAQVLPELRELAEGVLRLLEQLDRERGEVRGASDEIAHQATRAQLAEYSLAALRRQIRALQRYEHSGYEQHMKKVLPDASDVIEESDVWVKAADLDRLLGDGK